MIDKIFKKRRYVREYDSSADISQSLIDSLLQKTWKVTPSKNNFMPYTIHVVGPEHQNYKDLVFLNCASNEGLTDGLNDPLEQRYKSDLPNYANILSCSYLLIFTMRLEDKPNPFQKMLIEKGHRYEAVDEHRLNDLYATAAIEVGLFADCFSALCLQNNIDVSFVGCFHRDLDKWKDIPFVTRQPILLMTVGKGKVYKKILKNDQRPDYNRIVNFV